MTIRLPLTSTSATSPFMLPFFQCAYLLRLSFALLDRCVPSDLRIGDIGTVSFLTKFGKQVCKCFPPFEESRFTLPFVFPFLMMKSFQLFADASKGSLVTQTISTVFIWLRRLAELKMLFSKLSSGAAARLKSLPPLKAWLYSLILYGGDMKP